MTAGSSLSEAYLLMLFSKAEWSDMIFNDCKINNWVGTGQVGIYLDVV